MSTSSSISVSYFNKYKKPNEIPKTTSKIYSSVENNIIDIKNFYLNYLISILRSSLIDGINSLFNDIIKTKDKKNISIETVELFKQALKDISLFNSTQKINLAVKIKDNIKSPDILDKTIKSVFKSYIILLTFNSTNKIINNIKEKFYQQIDTQEFIYRCYVEFSQILFFNTDIFIKYHNNMYNYSEPINSIVHSAIESAIFRMLPMTDIMNNYLNYNEEDPTQNTNLLIDISKFIITKINKSVEENTNKIIKMVSNQPLLSPLSVNTLSDHKTITIPVNNPNIGK